MFDSGQVAQQRAALLSIMDRHFGNMRDQMNMAIRDASEKLQIEERNRINAQFQEWAQRNSWDLINAA